MFQKLRGQGRDDERSQWLRRKGKSTRKPTLDRREVKSKVFYSKELLLMHTQNEQMLQFLPSLSALFTKAILRRRDLGQNRSGSLLMKMKIRDQVLTETKLKFTNWG